MGYNYIYWILMTQDGGGDVFEKDNLVSMKLESLSGPTMDFA